MQRIYPAILSGGTGTRLWPLSRQQTPKQLLSLAGSQTLIQNTLFRTLGREFRTPLVVCHADHRFMIAEQMREIGITDAQILLEPLGRNTAPAAAAAALTILQHDPDALILVLPADHAVQNTEAFHQAVVAASGPASEGALVTFGIAPTRPETGYGYIHRGEPLEGHAAFEVTRFVEKPDAATARTYLADGGYLWNSGMFLFRADTYVTELERWEPDLLVNCRQAVAQGQQETDFFRLAEAPFKSCRSISIDYAVMERTERAVVVPTSMGWSDIGSWSALWDASSKDDSGNAVHGQVLHSGTRGSYLRSEGPMLAAVGIENIAVIATQDAVLVCSRDAAQDVKGIVELLERQGGSLHIHHPRVERPWGSYEVIGKGDGYQVKRIIVNPGEKLSLQMHHKRAEHWVVVAGKALVTCGDETFPLGENQTAFIPQGARHRLENPGAEPLHLIEVQYGSYLGEDDIVRFEDSYGR